MFAIATLWAAAGACSARPANAPQGNLERQSDAEYDLARDDFFKGRPRSALDHCRKAIELNDQNANALYFASAIHLSFCSGDLELASPDCRLGDAENFVRRALRVNDTFREARNTLGQILILEKRYAEAIAVLTPLTQDPAFESNYLAWGNLGWAQVLSGHVDEGIASLKSSVTELRFCVGHYRLGVAYEKKGDFAAAEQSLTNAVTVEAPDCKNLQDAWEERAQVRMKLGKLADARADFQKCRDIGAESRAGKACVDALARIQ
ncbi:MAG TPA: tetratricopeptide repeat protein [Polyangiaceae bacterium]|jgi:Tfp pilus assembly protein PilF